MLHKGTRLRFLGSLVALTLTGACIQEVSGEPVPAAARLYYPNRLALSPDGRTALVVNTNFDQRFKSAWLTQVDLPALLAAADPAAAMAALSQGPHVASLGGPLVVDASNNRAYMTHRGLGLLTAFDIDAAAEAGGVDAWHCGHGDRAGLSNRLRQTSCDAAHIFDLQQAAAQASDLDDDPLRDEFLDPFALVQSGNDALSVGFLATPRIARISVAPPLRVTAMLEGPKDSRLTDLAALRDGLLVGAGRSSFLDGAGANESLLLGWQAGAADYSRFSPSRALGSVGEGLGGQPEITRIMAAPDGSSRLFVLGRRPDTVSIAQLVVVPESRVTDGTVQVTTQPGRFRIAHTEVLGGQGLHEMAYLKRPTGNLLVVSSFVRDTLYFFADQGSHLTQVHRMHLTAGRGPSGMLPVTLDGKDYLLIATFFDNSLDLVDVSSANLADFRLAARVQDASYPNTHRAR